MARPLWTPTDAQRRQAETMAAYGIPEANIAHVLGVSKPTWRKHCGTELDTGATRANSKVADCLFYGICGGTGKPAFKDERARVTAAIFWMKTRGGWSETSTHKHTGVANGDPIEVEVGTVRERLIRRIARIAAAELQPRPNPNSREHLPLSVYRNGRWGRSTLPTSRLRTAVADSTVSSSV